MLSDARSVAGINAVVKTGPGVAEGSACLVASLRLAVARLNGLAEPFDPRFSLLRGLLASVLDILQLSGLPLMVFCASTPKILLASVTAASGTPASSCGRWWGLPLGVYGSRVTGRRRRACWSRFCLCASVRLGPFASRTG
jgi:hypothetical protein